MGGRREPCLAAYLGRYKAFRRKKRRGLRTGSCYLNGSLDNALKTHFPKYRAEMILFHLLVVLSPRTQLFTYFTNTGPREMQWVPYYVCDVLLQIDENTREN